MRRDLAVLAGALLLATAVTEPWWLPSLIVVIVAIVGAVLVMIWD